MPWILIKNNLKLMFRSKWILVFMCLAPPLIIGALTAAFESMMDLDYTIEEFRTGYRVEKDSIYSQGLEYLAETVKQYNIILQEFPEGSVEEMMADRIVDVFVEIKEDTYTIYRYEDKRGEAALIESIFSKYFYQYNEMSVLQDQTGDGFIINTNFLIIPEQKLDVDPLPPAKDYYGIIEIVYLMSCGMISLSAVIISERKNRIQSRLNVSTINRLQMYLGKFIPCIGATCVEAVIAIFISVILFEVHWGNIFFSVCILLLTIVATSAFGILLFYLFQNAAVSTVVGWIVLYVSAYLGGSFQMYMYSDISETVAKWSPHYYINRTLVEFSTMGQSNYASSCIIYLFAILLFCGISGMAIMNKRLEES